MKTLRWVRVLVVNSFQGSKTSGLRGHGIILRRVLSVAFLLTFVGSLVSYASDDLELIQAASKGDIAEVTNLLAQGADVNTKDAHGYTVLMWATIYGHSEVVKILEKAGAKE